MKPSAIQAGPKVNSIRQMPAIIMTERSCERQNRHSSIRISSLPRGSVCNTPEYQSSPPVQQTTTLLNSSVSWLVFNVPFQHKYGYIRDERSGVESYPYQYRRASDILTSTLATFLFSSHPKMERDREAHLNYYTSADNRERQPSHHKTKLNKYSTNTHMHPKHKKIQQCKINPKKL